jgi:hypothetical protein
MAKRSTPDKNGKASEITDPMVLYARIGWRAYRAWLVRADEPGLAAFYDSWNRTDMRRLRELAGEADDG